MRIRCLAIVIAVAGLAGCQEQDGNITGYGWSRPNSAYGDFQNDADACRRAATVRSPRTSSDAVGYRADVRRDYDNCMKARGWVYEKSTGPDPAKVMVDCKLPSVEQVQRLSAMDCDNRFGKILDSPNSSPGNRGTPQQ
jgi:hypothetical protein